MRVLCNVRRTDRYLLASRVILCSVKSSPSRRKNPSSCSLISGWKIYERIQRREKEKERKERKKGKGRRERSVRYSDDKTCPVDFPDFRLFFFEKPFGFRRGGTFPRALHMIYAPAYGGYASRSLWCGWRE